MGCPDCMLIFASEEEMLNHFTQPPHQPPPFSQPNKCPVMTCDMNFPNKAKLIWHLREGRHGQACPQCGKSFPKVKNIILKSFSINSQSCPFYSLTILSCTSEVIQLIGHLLVSIVTNPTRMHLLCILTSRLITQWQKDHIFVQNVELHLWNQITWKGILIPLTERSRPSSVATVTWCLVTSTKQRYFHTEFKWIDKIMW